MNDEPAHFPSAVGQFDREGFLRNLTHRPGVYKMLDAAGEIIYVGKARNLKKRVSSYFTHQDVSPKHAALVARIAAIEVSVTHTEGEALLLESQLIKRHKPRYNIFLRDDKSYPYIYVSTHQDFPRLTFHRGARRKQGRYFGPYPSAGAVRQSLQLLQKIFPIRQCEDSFFKNRSRACLQHQIERCTAPCVGLIGPEAYDQDVQHTVMFLEGDTSALIDRLVAQMERSAQALEFEKAARYRDQIATIRKLMTQQSVALEKGEVDVVACATHGAATCVHVIFIRHGQQLGDRAFFPQVTASYEPSQVLEAFLGQYYIGKRLPKEIILSHTPKSRQLLEEVLGSQAGHKVKLTVGVRGDRNRWLEAALVNAETALKARLASRQNLHERFFELGQLLHLEDVPQRIECFDISHTQGDQTVAACVVMNHEGPQKSAYRRFNIEGVQAGDDYGAIAQAVRRRYQRVLKGEVESPDVLFIDGGKGQVSAARGELLELGMHDLLVVGIAKGQDRKAGMETLFVATEHGIVAQLPTPATSLLIQQVRDEAHRFAITGHRQRREKAKLGSTLEQIDGLGPKRRQVLLKQFGGLREVSRAGVDALAGVEGISRQLAQRIYDFFHEQDA